MSRTPLQRQYRAPITARAVELFAAMEAVECSCPPCDWGGAYWHHEPCTGCDEWWRLHSDLHDELRLRPDHWPAYEHPDAANPYPEGSEAARQWRPDRRGRAMFRALNAAARPKPRPRPPRAPASPRDG